jgi:hypothetical protein
MIEMTTSVNIPSLIHPIGIIRKRALIPLRYVIKIKKRKKKKRDKLIISVNSI